MNKLTKYKKNKLSKTQKIVISFVLIILTIGVGYSALTTNLSISGNITVSGRDYMIDYTYYINNTLSNSLPDNDGTVYKLGSSTTCNNGVTLSWSNIRWELSSSTLSQDSACTVYFEETTGNPGEDCQGQELLSTIPNNLTGLASIMANNAVLDNVKSENVSSCSGVDFTNISSDTNGKGVYEIASTKDDTYPIYYYRGEVNNNNVLFANFCWKAVRTTDTGGVKLIYNGAPDANGDCTNTTGTDTQVGKSRFYTASRSPSDIGYMYGTRYTTTFNGFTTSSGISTYLFSDDVTYSNGTYTLTDPHTISDWSTNYENYVGYYTCSSTSSSSCSEVEYMVKTTSSNYFCISLKKGAKGNEEVKFGNDVSYSGGTYTLLDTIGVKAADWLTKYNSFNNNHYTCFTTGNTCSTVFYMYYTNNNNYFHINISGGKKISDALNDAFSNNYNSTAKSSVDNWYGTNLNSYTSKIEDTVYCNDRSASSLGGWNPNGGDTSEYLLFSPSNRLLNPQNISLACTRNDDKFTVSSSIGNGKLTYPVGLITSDEVIYAGGNVDIDNNKYYLYTNSAYWTMSPYHIDSGLNSAETYVTNAGDFHKISTTSTHGIRPVISLSPSVTIQEGTDGTAENPYVIID